MRPRYGPHGESPEKPSIAEKAELRRKLGATEVQLETKGRQTLLVVLVAETELVPHRGK